MRRRIADKEATPEVGEEFCTNSIIKKISFTGSTAVGKHLMQMSSNTVKRLSLGKCACMCLLMCIAVCGYNESDVSYITYYNTLIIV